ncbi:hypothetical protein D3C76_1647450 [compost metagenome]
MVINGRRHKITGRHHHVTTDNQRDSLGMTDNHPHAQGLRAPAALFQLRLVGLGHVADRNQRAVCIIQAHFTQPKTTNIGRND